MSALNNNKKTFELLNEYFIKVNTNANAFSCESTNLSSILSKYINIIVLNEKIETNEIDININETTNLLDDYNSTFTLNNTNDYLSSSTNIRSDYDYSGAFYYILYILIWYGLFVIILIVIQTKMSNLDEFEFNDDPRDITAQNLLKRIRNEDIKKEALEDLRNPIFRQKIWDIYFDNPNTYKIRRVDSKRIQKIDRKLRQYYTMNGSESKPTTNTNSNINNDLYKSFETSSLQDRPVSTNRQISFPFNKTNENNLFLLRDLTKFEIPTSFNNYNTVNSINKNNYPISSSNTFHSTSQYDKSNLQQLTNLNVLPNNQPQISNSSNHTNKSQIPSVPSVNRFKIEKLTRDIV